MASSSSSSSSSESKHEALQPVHPSMKGKLDPVFEKLYNDNVADTPLRPIDLAVLRRNYSALYSYGTGPAPDVGRIYDDTIPIIDDDDDDDDDDGSSSSNTKRTLLDVRVYEPSSPGPWPVHVDFHGGGWGLGDLDTEAHICRHICHRANVVVIDVAYRLVPEHAFPVGVTDSWAALRYIHAHGAARFNVQPARGISLGGVSAGAFIALSLAHLARDHRDHHHRHHSPAPIPLKLVVVGTPVIDDLSQYAAAAESPFPSMRENEWAPTLNWARLVWFDKLKWSSLPAPTPSSEGNEFQGSGGGGGGDAAAAVAAAQREKLGWFLNLLKAPNYRDLPKTVIYTAGADPLRDEGERYAQLLVENGVEVTLKRFPGVPHPFMHMDKDLWQAREFIDKTAREIRLVHHHQ